MSATSSGPVAYVMSRFPKLTETFILFEILAMRELGVDVRVYPLLRQREPMVHPEARDLVRRATYLPFLSVGIVASNLAMLLGRPRAYLGALATLIAETLRSPRYLAAGVALFPKIVHMARDMERRSIRHVHCHFSSHPAVAGFVIRRLTGIPFSFTAHGSDLHVDRTMLCRKLAEAGFAVAISDDNRRVMVETCGPAAADRVEVIHCGVDTGVFTPRSPSATRSTAAGALSILAIGTLHEVKGQRFLLDAVAKLRDAGVDVTCRLVGVGPDEEKLRRLVESRGLGARVTFLGARTRPEIVDLLGAADVLAAPSVPTRSGRREGIPVVLMEAMASGLPVVASRLSGIPELVDDDRTGLLVPPGDSTALADALARLASDPGLRARLGVAARERVIADFDVRRNAARLAARIDAVGASLLEGRTEGRSAAPRGRPRAFTVALVGPDGAGKTSIARRLVREVGRPAAYLYMGVNAASGNHLLPTTWLRERLRGRRGAAGGHGGDGPPDGLEKGTSARATVRRRLRAGLGLANRVAEEAYRQAIAWWHVARGRVVIFDRHYYFDYHATDIADPKRSGGRRLHGLFLERLYPKPELVIYLDAPAAVLFARKGEGTLASLEQKRLDYMALGRQLPAFAIVDATQPQGEVIAQVRERIEAFARNGSSGNGSR